MTIVETDWPTTAEGRARDLIVFADGAEEAGLVDYARRARDVARDVLELVPMLAAERSGRVAMQEGRDRCVAVLARQAYDATLPNAFRKAAAAALDAETDQLFGAATDDGPSEASP